MTRSPLQRPETERSDFVGTFDRSQPQDSRQACLAALRTDGRSYDAWLATARCYEREGDRDRACRALLRAVCLAPDRAEAYGDFSRLCQNSNAVSTLCRRTIAKDESDPDWHLARGRRCLAAGDCDGAIAACLRARELQPDRADILHVLADAYASAAASAPKDTLERNEPAAKSRFHRSFAFFWEKDWQRAIASLRVFLQAGATGESNAYPDVYTIARANYLLGRCLDACDRPAEAAAAYGRALQHHRTPVLHEHRICAYLRAGDPEAAVRATCEVAGADERFLFNLDAFLQIPVAYETEVEIESTRQKIGVALEYFNRLLLHAIARNPRYCLKRAGCYTTFFLAYQGKNDRAFQILYGRLLHGIVAANYPQWSRPLTLHPRENGKIRVGYLSPQLYAHTVGKLFGGWISYSNKRDFEIYSYHTGQTCDRITQSLQADSDRFYHLPYPDEYDASYIENVAAQIRRDRLHVLVFLDLAMHPCFNLLAALRLAPIQCVTWGHPVTSGLPHADYFLTSDGMEPQDARDHYSEQLVPLPNLGIVGQKQVAAPPQRSRAELQLREGAIVYVSTQKIYKYLPQHDEIYPRIALQVPQAQFVFTFGSEKTAPQHQQRLQQAFRRFGLECDRFCTVLPLQKGTAYVDLLQHSDIYLDSFSWSGGMTTLDAIVCNLPIVTCPGAFMRGRHTYAMLRCMGVVETIASDAIEYANIAARLGYDPAWRSQISEKIEQQKYKIYNDLSVIETLEAFYRRIVP